MVDKTFKYFCENICTETKDEHNMDCVNCRAEELWNWLDFEDDK